MKNALILLIVTVFLSIQFSCNEPELYKYVIIERGGKTAGQNKIEFTTHMAQSGFFDTNHTNFPKKDTSFIISDDRFDYGQSKWFSVNYYDNCISIIFRYTWDGSFMTKSINQDYYINGSIEDEDIYLKLFKEIKCDSIFLSNSSNPFANKPKPMYK